MEEKENTTQESLQDRLFRYGKVAGGVALTLLGVGFVAAGIYGPSDDGIIPTGVVMASVGALIVGNNIRYNPSG